jgi:hypothetical protein
LGGCSSAVAGRRGGGERLKSHRFVDKERDGGAAGVFVLLLGTQRCMTTQPKGRGREGALRVFRLRLCKAEFVQKQVLNVALDREIGHNTHICGAEYGGAVLRFYTVLHDCGFQPLVCSLAVPVLLNGVLMQKQHNGKECRQFFFRKPAVFGQKQDRQVTAGSVTRRAASCTGRGGEGGSPTPLLWWLGGGGHRSVRMAARASTSASPSSNV